MLFTSSLVVAALVSVAQAQTPQGFQPAANNKLDVLFNNTAVNRPGQMLTKAMTATQPQLALPASGLSAQEEFVFVMVDLDVPPTAGSTERRTLLHAMVTNFKASSQKVSGNATLLTSSEKGPAAYLGPGPPATDTMAHRYVQLLFKQPANLKVSASDFANTQARIGFNVETFAQTNNLGQPLAGNFFLVDGRAGGAGTATGTGGIARNTLQPFTGAAGRTEMSMGLAAVVGGLAFLGL